MRNKLLLTVCWLLCSVRLALAEAWPPLPVQKLAEGVYGVMHPDAAQTPANGGAVGNRGFLVGTSGVVVINPGPSRRYGLALVAAIRRVTPLPVVAVIDTQARPEQSLANDVFRELGVPLLASARTATLMDERCERCLAQAREDAGEAALAGTRIAVPSGVLFDGQKLDLAGRRLVLRVFDAGMVPGQTAVFDEASGVLFTGAAVSLDHIPTLRDADLPAARAAIDQLSALAPRLVVPDRGPPSLPARMLEFRRYLEQIERQVSQAFEQGQSAEEAESHARLPEFAPWAGYAWQHSANVLRVYLRAEQF